MLDLESKVVVVTGASRGIGSAMARYFAAHKAKVVLNFKSNSKAAKSIEEEIIKNGGEAISIQADVADRDAVEKMAEEVEKHFGPVDVLVNNAGPSVQQKGFFNLEWQDFQRHVDVSLKGTFNCCFVFGKQMKEREQGSIINVLSAWILGTPPGQQAPYVTIKSALEGFSKSLAVELGPHNVNVNMISPGPTKTDLNKNLPDRFFQEIVSNTPMRKLTELDDIAVAALFLASPYAKYLTGINLPVCGGEKMPL